MSCLRPLWERAVVAGTFLLETGQVTSLRPKAPTRVGSEIFFRFSNASRRAKSLPQLALTDAQEQKAEEEPRVYGEKAEIAEQTVLVWGCSWPETGVPKLKINFPCMTPGNLDTLSNDMILRLRTKHSVGGLLLKFRRFGAEICYDGGLSSKFSPRLLAAG
jgi:hypothetical protein